MDGTTDEYCTRLNGNTDEVLLGIKKAAAGISGIVEQTAGPYGHNVMLMTRGNCRITKDGISVLRSMVEPGTDYERIALSVIRSASDETNRKAGDGTTATCILANEIFQQGYNYLVAGVNGNRLRNGITKAASLAAEMVEKSIATPISTDRDIYDVAKVSANGSDEIAQILTDVFSKIGRDGTARVELSNTDKTTSKIVHGMTFDSGLESSYFANNEHGEAVLENPLVLLVNRRLTVLGELLKPFEALAKTNRPILVVADGYDQDILNTFVLNKMRGLPICAVAAPSYNPWKTKMMEDIAVVVGGRVISPETGLTLDSVVADPSIAGTARQVIVTQESTSIVVDPNAVDQERLAARIREIDHELEDEAARDHDREMNRARKARLTTGIGIISVGGSTEAEMHEKKDLVDDAFASVSSSQKKGVVPGCGLTYLAVHDALYAWLSSHVDQLSSEEASGFRVFADSLTRPFLAICGNSGSQNAQFALGCIQNSNRSAHQNDPVGDGKATRWTLGMDLGTGDMVDVVERGIIDSASAVMETMRNGASAGAQLLSLSGVVSTPVRPVPQQVG